MKLSTALLTGAVALAGVASFGGTAHALPTFNAGSIAFQATTGTTTALSSTTQFQLSSATNLVSGAGDFLGMTASGILNFGPLLDLANASSFSFDADGLGSFVANGSVLNETFSNGVLSFALVGTYTVGADFSNAGTLLTADETFSLTQTNGAGNAISISGTFQSPQQVVPEPMTLAVFGAGLIGLGVMRRRTKA